MWFNSMRLARRSHSPFRAVLFALFLVVSSIAGSQITWAQSSPQPAAQLPPVWNDAVARLASKIGSIAGSPGTISLTVKNSSSLTDADVAAISQALRVELKRLRFSVVPESSAQTHALVTLSEGTEGYVWVAQVQNTDAERLAMVTVTKANDITSGPLPVIARNLVWEQPDPFLDFEWHEFAGGVTSTTTVLEFGNVRHYLFARTTSSTPLRDLLQPGSALKATGDPRGEFIDTPTNKGGAMVSGALCVSSTSWVCGDPSGGVWPLWYGIGGRFAAGRNYFTGLDFGEGVSKVKQIPFYSVSFMHFEDGGEFWITTELDGKARLYEGLNTPTAIFSGWGDDIATIKTACNREWQVLVTGTGDRTQPDHIQIYEIKDRRATPVGQPLEFPGPILALWPSNDMRSARVVSRNLQTGMYEASIVSVTCSE
jgi:hypothetical protein